MEAVPQRPEGGNMNWLWANVPLMMVFFAAIAGVPLWLSLRHPDTGPPTSSPAETVASP
jgi:hypothetical protein